MNANGRLSAYDEVIQLIESLPVMVRETRRRRQMSLREAAVSAGCSFSTISRIEQGKGTASLESFVVLLKWCSE
jgi:transcriptional regulator with XRE-family HTH domain